MTSLPALSQVFPQCFVLTSHSIFLVPKLILRSVGYAGPRCMNSSKCKEWALLRAHDIYSNPKGLILLWYCYSPWEGSSLSPFGSGRANECFPLGPCLCFALKCCSVRTSWFLAPCVEVLYQHQEKKVPHPVGCNSKVNTHASPNRHLG